LFQEFQEERERVLGFRTALKTAHRYIMSGLMVAAASAAFFLGGKGR
jgi:hypothetical protein